MGSPVNISLARTCPWLLIAVVATSTAGCIHFDEVTVRPEYAYPQNLVSMCDGEHALAVSNRGEFVTSDHTSKSDRLLLSAQLLGGDPQEHRLVTRLLVDLTRDGGVTVQTVDERGVRQMRRIPADRLHCDDAGELQLTYPPENAYFWASVDTRSHMLALWTNARQELVIQNRWRQRVIGLISGEVKGDAWARFASVAPDPSVGRGDETVTVARSKEGTEACDELSGSFLPVAEVINADGSLDSRTAIDQFFREELIGVQPVNQATVSPTRMHVGHQLDAGITLELYAGDVLLDSRLLPASSLSCLDGRWVARGEKILGSPWLLIAASAAVQWEDLSLWRDRDGALLVQGRYVTRALLLLIPFGGAETMFMAFPAL